MRLWPFVAVLAVVHAAIAIAMTIISNGEGGVGAIAYAAMYVGPALLVSAALRSRERGRHLVAGWSSVVLSLFYIAIMVGNWPGYAMPQQAFAIAVNGPSVGLYLVVFGAVVLRRREVPPLGGA